MKAKQFLSVVINSQSVRPSVNPFDQAVSPAPQANPFDQAVPAPQANPFDQVPNSSPFNPFDSPKFTFE